MITDMSYESIQPYNMTQITFSWQLRPTISKNVQVYKRCPVEHVPMHEEGIRADGQSHHYISKIQVLAEVFKL